MSDFNIFVDHSIASVWQLLSGLALPALFFVCIGFLVKRRRLLPDILRAAREGALNLQIAVVNIIFITPFLIILSEGMFQAVQAYGLAFFSPASWSWLPVPVVILIGIFIADFVGYWRHRLEHTALLWPAHAVHHSDTEMTWLTLERFHPLNRLTTFAIDSGALLALGFPAYVVIANSLVRHYYGYVIHADLPWTYGRGSYVFVSPAMHRWHHSADSRFFETNFATVFSVFDRAFGTFRVPGPCTSPLGVTDDIAPTLPGQLGYMFQPRAYGRIARRLGLAKVLPAVGKARTPDHRVGTGSSPL